MNKIKISNHQLFALVANFTIGTTIINASSGVAGLAKQDAWISALIAPVIGLPFIWMYYELGKLYPGKTLIEIIGSVFGKWFGWIVSAIFVLFVCLLDATQVVTYIGNFMQTEYMTETPLYALNLLVIIALTIGLLYGLEAIARSAEVFVFTITVLIIFAMAMDIPNIKIENLLPIFEEGVTPALKGMFHLSSYMTWPLIVLLFIYPININDTLKARRSLFFGYLFGAGINFICTTMSIMVLGAAITAKSNYPTYLLAKEIDVGTISRIEGIVAGAWILSEFIKTILYYYAGVIGLSQLLGLNDYKRMVLPLSLVMLVLSGIVYPDIAYQSTWDNIIWIPFITTFGAVLPIVLLLVSKIQLEDKLKE